MTSPFEFAANATLEFDIPSATGELESDSFGNPVPKTEKLVCTALLTQKRYFDDKLPGANFRQAEFTGYLVDPTVLPPQIREGTKARASIQINSNTRDSGIFEIYSVVQDPFLIAAGITDLSTIEGSFTW